MTRLIRLALSLYPAEWRARYGPEFEALLEQMNPGVGDLLDIARGALLMQLRRLTLSVPVAVCALLGAGAAALIVNTAATGYTSTSTIQVVTGDPAAEPSLTAVSRAFSDKNLARLLEQSDLYPAQRTSQSQADVIHRFRQDVFVVRKTSGAPDTTLGLSFTYPEARKAQDVTARLAGLVIEENFQLGAGAAGPAATFRITGPPRQAPSGPNAWTAMTVGVGTGLLAGLGIAAMRRRVSRA